MPEAGLLSRLDAGVRDLAPGYFALVMASGIMSIGMHGVGRERVSAALGAVATIAYAVLVALTLLRIVRHPHAMREDLADPARAFGFFTFVAASCVLGSRFSVEGAHGLALGLLIVGSLAWIVLGYVIPWTAVLGRATRPVLQTANGTWFIWAVASQSITVLAATLEVVIPGARHELAVLAVFSWSVGIFLYAAGGVFVAARMLLYELKPVDITPPYWVAMGATAITVVGGARIVEMAEAPMVETVRGLIAGASVFFWAFGTWLIPPLIFMGYWRHVRHGVPLVYEPAHWSIVFPLGMYGVGAQFLGQADHLPLVRTVGEVEIWFALAVWAIVFGAMCRRLVSVVGPGGSRRG